MAIIHRDVSPSNILCSAQGEVKLSDFGIAKAATHSSAFYRVRGKVGYMSPEQARNQPIDHRTDLYSVAVCLYEALTAERLFVGDLSTPADVIYAQQIVPPSQKRKGLPTALDVVLATALSENPDDRYQDSVAFADALFARLRTGTGCSTRRRSWASTCATSWEAIRKSGSATTKERLRREIHRRKRSLPESSRARRPPRSGWSRRRACTSSVETTWLTLRCPPSPPKPTPPTLCHLSREHPGS